MISWKKGPAVQAVAIPAEFMECKAGDLLIEAARPSDEAEEGRGENEPQVEVAGGAN